METESSLTCTVNLEWLNTQGIAIRKVLLKQANLRLIRNDLREIFLEISERKTIPMKLHLKNYNVFNKFMNEGKTSIKFQDISCHCYISNAPPGQLFTFLRAIFIKTNGQKKDETKLNQSLRTQLLLNNNKSKQFDEISPITTLEVDNAKAKISRGTETTPSPSSKKRKAVEHDNKAPIAKKLYSSSPSSSASSSPIPNESLDIEQKEVFDACLNGRNVFFTGSAGTGKSHLLRRIIGALPPDVTVATGSTGVAACQIGGVTLHQFAGIGDSSASLERCLELAQRPASALVWRRCKHLIIDEISMIDGDLFERIEFIARKIRRNDKPFGGIQLILCGDFLQLPPVMKDNKKKVKFCFQTKAWDRCIDNVYELKHVYRQNDDEFIEILNKIRLGVVNDEIVKKLTATSKQIIENNGILATRLCSHTQEANTINETKLENLIGEKRIYTADDSDKSCSKQIDQLSPAPNRLELKIGAQVMLLKNISIASGLVNGARGVIKSFEDNLPMVQFRNREYLINIERWTVKLTNGTILIRKQLPLKLAWAFSIHKSQGLTLDCVEMSLGKVFEPGQAYVALSRAQNLKTLRVLDFNRQQVWANPDVLQFYQKIHKRMELMRIIPLGDKSNNRNDNKENTRKLKSLPFSKKLLNKPLITIS